MLNVREVMNEPNEPVEIPCMIKDRPINIEAKFARIKILKESLLLLETDLNQTDTSDMSELLALDYNFLKLKYEEIIKKEYKEIEGGL